MKMITFCWQISFSEHLHISYFYTLGTKLPIFDCLQAKKAKQAENDRKRAEVRKRMEEASKAKKAKKGFMTPDRKKKLRVRILTITFFLTVHAKKSL